MVAATPLFLHAQLTLGGHHELLHKANDEFIFGIWRIRFVGLFVV